MVTAAELEAKIDASSAKVAALLASSEILKSGLDSANASLETLDSQQDELKAAFEALKEQLGGGIPASTVEKLEALEASIDGLGVGIEAAAAVSSAVSEKAAARLAESDAIDAPAPTPEE